MSENELQFKKSQTEQDILNVYNYELEAFADYPGFKWTLEGIKEDVRKNGWNLYSVLHGEDIVAAAFLKKDKKELLTKNTPIKLAYQGQGFSHQIKDFFEQKAKELNVKTIVNFCPENNFRLISLNESHGYEQVDSNKDTNIQKWVKTLS